MPRALVAPDPSAVVARHGVVQHAAPKRRLRAGRVELDRASEDLVEAVEALRSGDELRDRRGLVAIDAGCHVDQDHAPNEIRRHGGQRDRRQAAERHPHDGPRVGSELADGDRDIGRVLAWAERAVVAVVGVPVAREIDRGERTIERERDRVPRVGVLCTAVEQHDLGRSRAPEQRAQSPPRRVDDDGLASDGGRAVERQAELLGVLVEQPELVVVRRSRHGGDVSGRCEGNAA